MKTKKKYSLLKSVFVTITLSLFYNCTNSKAQEDAGEKVFSSLAVSKSKIEFSNILTENDSLNYFTYSYLYMGGGVSAGDINNDGLIDLYFTGNQVSNKLYLNKGNLQFEDVTEKSGVAGDNRWYTGTTMADVNGDGLLDIYCSVGGKFGTKENQLFINNGNGTFKEQAKTYKIADIGNSVQSTFFDYDKDGDLDLYVANYPPTKFSSPTFVYAKKMQSHKDYESDHLYRNDGNTFTNVTDSSGLRAFGLSLSATIGDLNNDSWPDIYVSNDFNSGDFMYINNQDGTFSEHIKEATNHTSFYGMGVDISDFNNDGNLDIFQVDMDAETNKRKKTNMASMNPQLFKDVVAAGFHYQYMHNCMQLNTGVFKKGVPHFSNVSRLTGTSSTDWSWGPLFADFDNDGLKDLYISNGTRREINNNDFFNKMEKDKSLTAQDLLSKSQQIPSEKIDNYMFRNKGGLQFEKVNKKWGIQYEGFSNGVTYADLDNDGDLEIITNNIDDKASVFENHSAKTNNFIKIKFNGGLKNKFGIGNRVYITTVGGSRQMQELTLTRGFQSSVAPVLHFGLNKIETIDEIEVVWNDGKVQILNNVKANQTLTLNKSESKSKLPLTAVKIEKSIFEEVATIFPEHKHQENDYNDFDKQVLLPHKMSTLGPALTVGDLNNDGLEDYFIGGSASFVGQVYLQTKKGFEPLKTNVFDTDKQAEDIGAVIFDADNDGDNDLYVVSGGYEYAITSPLLNDRLYINNGKKGFSKASTNALPEMLVSGSKVYAQDFDKDGKKDLLVLGRQIPGQYPSPASSYILKNNSTDKNIKFDLTSMSPKAFENLGMATSAVVTDYNNDSWEDIIVVGEWMPIRVFKNTKGEFTEVTSQLGLNENTTGWWWSINQGDFDNDGDMDYVIGNNGENYKYKASKNESFDIYVNDFDENNKNDIVLSYYSEGKQYPLRGRECSSQQIPGIKDKYKDYESFSKATLIDVYSKESLSSALHYQVKSFASIYLENNNGKFIIRNLPVEAQLSSINQILVEDFDGDDVLDVLLAGNMYNSEVETPRNDAGFGLFLVGNGKGGFDAIEPSESGLFIPGDVKDLKTIRVDNKRYIIVVKNNDAAQFIEIKKSN